MDRGDQVEVTELQNRSFCQARSVSLRTLYHSLQSHNSIKARAFFFPPLPLLTHIRSLYHTSTSHRLLLNINTHKAQPKNDSRRRHLEPLPPQGSPNSQAQAHHPEP